MARWVVEGVLRGEAMVRPSSSWGSAGNSTDDLRGVGGQHIFEPLYARLLPFGLVAPEWAYRLMLGYVLFRLSIEACKSDKVCAADYRLDACRVGKNSLRNVGRAAGKAA